MTLTDQQNEMTDREIYDLDPETAKDMGIREPNDMTVEQALKELREIFPGCSLELVSRFNAGFYKEPERYFDIGVISPDYHINKRVQSATTLSEAMAQVREWKDKQND